MNSISIRRFSMYNFIHLVKKRENVIQDSCYTVTTAVEQYLKYMVETVKPKCVYQEERWTRSLITIDNLPDNFEHLQVNNHSKIRNMLGFAVKSFEHSNHLVCSASGPSVNKAVTCAEILKRQMPELKQVTGIGYRNVRMIKDEMIDGKVSQTITTRRLPSIHILLSKNHLHPSLPGYQGADKVSDHVNRPVSRRTFEKTDYRGTKEG